MIFIASTDALGGITFASFNAKNYEQLQLLQSSHLY